MMLSRRGEALLDANAGRTRCDRRSAFLHRVLEANAHVVVGDHVDQRIESHRGIERAASEALRGAADAAITASARSERLAFDSSPTWGE